MHRPCQTEGVGEEEVGWPPAGMGFGRVAVLGSRMGFVASDGVGGDGESTVLLVHGNPTSSYLWRRVLPGLVGSVRCVAVDLIGMGRSGKPDIGYGFADHAAYLEAFADELELRNVAVVGHDWGAVLGLDLLRRRPDVVGRIAVCEGHLHPFDRWEDMGPGAGELFSQLRTPRVGERLVLEENLFVEQVLRAGMNRELTAAEHDAYRDPAPAARRARLGGRPGRTGLVPSPRRRPADRERRRGHALPARRPAAGDQPGSDRVAEVSGPAAILSASRTR